MFGERVTHPQTAIKKNVRENHGYDFCNLDEQVLAAIREADSEEDFHVWLDSVMKVEGNRMRNTPESRLDFEATYKIEAGTFHERPGFEIKLVIAEGGQSGTDYSGADVDVDWLEVHAEEIKRFPSLGQQVVVFVTQQNAEGKFPTRQEMAAALARSTSDIHNALVDVQWRKKLVEPVPGPVETYRVVNGEPGDPATLFRAADAAEKKRLLTTTADVYAVKAMLATLTHSGPLSPSSNVPDALHRIMGDTPWPAVIGEATTLLAREHGRMWAYSGD